MRAKKDVFGTAVCDFVRFKAQLYLSFRLESELIAISVRTSNWDAAPMNSSSFVSKGG